MMVITQTSDMPVTGASADLPRAMALSVWRPEPAGGMVNAYGYRDDRQGP
jgi:hypothetical protein